LVAIFLESGERGRRGAGRLGDFLYPLPFTLYPYFPKT
jgi:hypothetical protein